MHAERLHELADVFELVWATSWNVDERALLSALVSLPDFGGAISLPGGLARRDVEALLRWVEANC